MRTGAPLLSCILCLAGGCVSVNNFSFDDEISPSSNLVQACGYLWPGEIKISGSDMQVDASISGDSIKREVEIRCKGIDAPVQGQAAVSGQYSVQGPGSQPASAALLLGSLWTAGVLPVPASAGSVSLCLDITLPDRGSRRGCSGGTVNYVSNIWGEAQGTADGRGTRAAYRVQFRQMQLLKELVPRAFHKAWVPLAENLDQANQASSNDGSAALARPVSSPD